MISKLKTTYKYVLHHLYAVHMQMNPNVQYMTSHLDSTTYNIHEVMYNRRDHCVCMFFFARTNRPAPARESNVWLNSITAQQLQRATASTAQPAWRQHHQQELQELHRSQQQELHHQRRRRQQPQQRRYKSSNDASRSWRRPTTRTSAGRRRSRD